MRKLMPAVLVLALALPAAPGLAAPVPGASYETAALAGYRAKTTRTAYAQKKRAAKKHRAEMRRKAQLRKKALRQQRRIIRARKSRRVIIRRGALRTAPAFRVLAAQPLSPPEVGAV